MIGDLFQQYAAKYIGIGRGIPLSNTNQLWGLAWGALVFGELSGQSATAQTLVMAGSLIMIAGAAAISFAEAPEQEQDSWRSAIQRECGRYGMDYDRTAAIMKGDDPISREKPERRWWELLVVAGAIGMFVWLGLGARSQPIAVNALWMAVVVAATLMFLAVCGWLLWKRTRFS